MLTSTSWWLMVEDLDHRAIDAGGALHLNCGVGNAKPFLQHMFHGMEYCHASILITGIDVDMNRQ